MSAQLDDQNWLDDREARAWRAFVALQLQIEGRIVRALQRETGLSEGDYGVLVQLSEAPNETRRVGEIGQALQWETSRLSHHLARMVSRGLVERHRCPTDSRGANIVLTDAGREAIVAAAPKHVEHVRRWFIDLLTPEQLAAFADIAETAIAGVED
jgi:DNA-binding MarR family transcriptional regulator